MDGMASGGSKVCADPAQNQTYCPAGVGRLGDLLRLVDDGSGTP